MNHSFIEQAIEMVRKETGYNLYHLRMRNRTPELVDARQLLCCVLNRIDGVAEQDIADILSIDRSSVYHLIYYRNIYPLKDVADRIISKITTSVKLKHHPRRIPHVRRT